MLSLTDDLVDAIKFEGTIYHLNLSFDNVIKYLSLIQDGTISDGTKETMAINLFFGNQDLPFDPQFFQMAFEVINEQIASSPYGNNNSGNERGAETPKQYFSYEKDAGAIYASFLQQYNIDLLKERGKLHWCVFRALFDGLSDNTQIQKIIELRQKNISDVPTENQGKVLELQNYYALKEPSKKTETEVFNDDALSSMFGALLGKAKEGGK